MALDATVGGESANSYVDEAYAYTYFQHHTSYSTWSEANSEDLLVYATTLLDALVDWHGIVVTDTQALEWPRDLPDGSDEGIIPKLVKQATCEMALYLSTNDSVVDDEKLKKISIGPIKLDFNVDDLYATLPPLVKAMVSKYGAIKSVSTNGIFTPRLQRT